MAITYIGGSTVASTSITIPGTYQNGDLIVIFAFNNASTTMPTTPTGWTSAGGNGANTCACRVGWKIAGSASDTSGTWTNATTLACAVYRGVATNKTPVGAVGNGNGNGSIITFQSPLMLSRGTSWVIGFAGHRDTGTDLSLAPTGMTNKAFTNTGTGGHIGVSDTNAPVSAFSTQTVSVGGVAAGWESFTVEIRSEQMNIQNYMGVDAGNGISVGEKIR